MPICFVPPANLTTACTMQSPPSCMMHNPMQACTSSRTAVAASFTRVISARIWACTSWVGSISFATRQPKITTGSCRTWTNGKALTACSLGRRFTSLSTHRPRRMYTTSTAAAWWWSGGVTASMSRSRMLQLSLSRPISVARNPARCERGARGVEPGVERGGRHDGAVDGARDLSCSQRAFAFAGVGNA